MVTKDQGELKTRYQLLVNRWGRLFDGCDRAALDRLIASPLVAKIKRRETVELFASHADGRRTVVMI